MIILTVEDTIATIASKMEAAAEERRAEAFAKAKGNLAKLMVAGVVITCDEEQDRAYKYAARCRRAAEAGRTYDQQAELEEAEERSKNVLRYLERVASSGETPDEGIARKEEILAAVPGLLDSGRKCRHHRTKQKRGWHPIGPELVCCECGAKILRSALDRKIPPTEQAVIAAGLLASFGG